MSSLRRLDAGFVVVALLSIVAIAPLTAPGFFLKAHDATIGAYFLWQFDQGIADGALYPRWAMDWTFGYGYPLFVVIAPLAFYVAEVFHLLGAGLIGGLKVAYALGFLFSGLAMYLLARDLFGRAGGTLAAVLYVYAPYHLADVYVRADLAEFFSFVFFPLVLWAILRLRRARSRRETARYVALGGLAYGGLVLTHITMAVLFTPIAAAYALLLALSKEEPEPPRRKERQEEPGGTTEDTESTERIQDAGYRIQDASKPLPASWILNLASCIAALTLGLAVAAAYWLPAFGEQRYIQASDLTGGYFSYRNHFVYPFQFLSPFWGYGYADIGPNDQMPYQLGVAAVVLAICSLWVVRRLSERRHLAIFLAAAALVVLAMTAVSQPVWDLLRPVLVFVQFPWRLLALTSLALALAGGALAGRILPQSASAAESEQAREQPAAAMVLVVLALLAGYTYTTPQYTDGEVSLARMIQFQLDTKEMLGNTRWVTEKPEGSPMVAQYLAGQAVTRVVPADSRAAVQVVHSGGASYEALVQAPAPTDVLLNIRYFPGWRVYLDGQRVEPQIRPPQGLMAVAVPQGEHRLRLRFEDTPLRLLAKVITLVGLALAGLLLWWGRRER